MLRRRLASLAIAGCGAVIFAAAAAGALGSCGGVMLPPVEMGNATASLECQDVISQVFADSGFVPVSMAEAPPMLFSPRTTAPLTFIMTLGWAIGVSFTAPCDFHLQALSLEPECVAQACITAGGPVDPLVRGPESFANPFDRGCYGLLPTCPLSPTGGPDYSAALTEMTRRIKTALAARPALRK